jgi:hypothetical protein
MTGYEKCNVRYRANLKCICNPTKAFKTFKRYRTIVCRFLFLISCFFNSIFEAAQSYPIGLYNERKTPAICFFTTTIHVQTFFCGLIGLDRRNIYTADGT